MKKRLISVVAIIIAVVLIAVFSANSTNLPENGTPDELMQAVILENQCLSCHNPQAPVPFYAKIPFVGKLIAYDMFAGLRSIDLNAPLVNLQQGKPVADSVREKLLRVAQKNTMPPLQYVVVHWNSWLTKAERQVIIDWAMYARRKASNGMPSAEEFKTEPVQPLPEKVEINSAKAALGKILYFDTRLSGDNTISCASCHGLNTGGVDRSKYSKGIKGQFGDINAPTVFNAALNFCQFWDGRAKSLEEQAGGPPLNPVEMGSKDWDEIISKLNKDAALKAEFAKVYPDGITAKNITNAIAEFELTLLTPDSKFDLYLKGDKTAMAKDEIEGYELFKEHGCATCHAGVNLGGSSFEYMNGDYFAHRGNIAKPDLGRLNQTKSPVDEHKFKTPTLRNVAVTAPYYHDGSVATLKQATELMLKHQCRTTLPDSDVDKIVKFLETLTGKYEGKLLK